jgi:hypothetical protein
MLWPALDRNTNIHYYAVDTAAMAGYRGTVDAFIPLLKIVIYYDTYNYFKTKGWGLTACDARNNRNHSNSVAMAAGFHVVRVYDIEVSSNHTMDTFLDAALQACMSSPSPVMLLTPTHPDNF